MHQDCRMGLSEDKNSFSNYEIPLWLRFIRIILYSIAFLVSRYTEVSFLFALVVSLVGANLITYIAYRVDAYQFSKLKAELKSKGHKTKKEL